VRSALLAPLAARRACSIGRNTLTSPEPGLSVPMKATINSGTKATTPAKPSPVATISSAAASNSVRGAARWPKAPTASVAIAEPASVAVPSTPTSNSPWPSASR
jgi:hypothetical protein